MILFDTKPKSAVFKKETAGNKSAKFWGFNLPKQNHTYLKKPYKKVPNFIIFKHNSKKYTYYDRPLKKEWGRAPHAVYYA